MAKPTATPTAGALVSAPAIILVEPQLGENIGAAARAMANFGLSQLRIVNPRDGWPNPQARASASGAEEVIEAAKLFDTTQAAVADLGFVFATTARARDISKPVRGPKDAAISLATRAAREAATGVLFGRERFGLSNEEVAFADEILTLPVDPTHYSLNIAQAVLLVSYEWRLAAVGDDLPFAGSEARQLADKADLVRLFEHLEGSLDDVGFFRPPERRPHLVLALRAILQRAQLSEQEVRTLRGVIAALSARPTRPRRMADGEAADLSSGTDGSE